jgi:cell division protein FtsW
LLLFVVLFLVALGIIMVYSSSSVISLQQHAHSLYYMNRQVVRVLVGLILMVGFILWDYRSFSRFSFGAVAVCSFLLLLVYVPGIGYGAGGSRRWLDLHWTRIQPSEFFKIAYIVYLAKFFADNDHVKEKVKKLILPQLGFILLICLLIHKQPDLSTAVLIGAIAFSMFFLVYSDYKLILTTLLGSGMMILYLVVKMPYRLKRWTAFLDPWENKLGAGYQIIQSLVSLGSGGILGLGLGQSRQKYFYLPEEHTDFIFAIIGEEFGYIGAFVVVIAFWLFLWRGIRVAFYAEDLLGKYMAFGITFAIIIQAALNLLVVVGLAPPTGVPLPFVSYGGSSLLTNLVAVGILLNISRFRSMKKAVR